MLVIDISIVEALLTGPTLAGSREVVEAVVAEIAEMPPRVPFQFHVDVAELLRRRLDEGTLTAAQSASFLAILEQLEVDTDRFFDRMTREVLQLARQDGLSIAEAAYLDTAMRAGATLATMRPLQAAAARKAGLTVLAPSEVDTHAASKS